MRDGQKKKLVIVGIQVFLAALHIIGVGRNRSQELFILSASYFSDLVLPFGFYFLLKLIEEQVSIFRKRYLKAALVFLLAASAEILQLFGVYALGRTFDPLDIAVYAFGVSLAVLVDFIFSKIMPFWKQHNRTVDAREEK